MAIDRRILELALKGLESERARVAAEITELSSRLGATGVAAGGSARKARKKVAKRAGRRKMSTAQRKLISERMKQAWARRRAKTR